MYDLKTSCSIERFTLFLILSCPRKDCIGPEQDFPEFLVQDKKVSLEEQKAQKADRFLRGREVAYLIFDYFQVTDVNESVLDYSDLFTVVLRNDNIQEFDTRWDDFFRQWNKSVQIKNTRV